MIRRIAARLAKIHYIRDAIENPTDLNELRQRPSRRMIFGLIVVGLSYLIGWPMVAFLGILAAFLREPAVVVIGGPLTYGFSHVLFWVGAWLAGARYVSILTRYATKRLFCKLLAIE